MQRGVIVLLLSPLLHAHALEMLVGRAAWMHARPRCRIPQQSLAAVDDAAAAYARTALLEEVAKAERSLPAIAAHVATLEAAALPSKLKRKLQGDWKLKFASDQAVVTPFTSGEGEGPFRVLEEVYHRLQSGDASQSIEVVRKIGPFGNSLQGICGKWSLAGGGKPKRKGKGGKGGDKGGAEGGGEEPAVLTWRNTYMIDARGREVDPPSGVPTSHSAVATHVSDDLMVMRFGSDGAKSASYGVFARTEKGELAQEFDNVYFVDGTALGIEMPKEKPKDEESKED